MLRVQGTWIWALVQIWLTPTGLFVLLNLVIGTIAITSMGARSHKREGHHYEPPKLARAPSVLERLRSIGSFRYRFDDMPPEFTSPPPPAPGREGFVEPPKLARTPSLLERLGSIGLYSHRSREIPPESSSPPPPAPSFEEFDESHAQGQHDYERSQSEPWAKAKSAPGRSEEEVDVVRRPSTARAAVTEEEEEVDARADDFITRFRQQLKLQRLDSFIRYKEMLNRGK